MTAPGPDEPLLLVGAQRSGTTALAHALSRGIADRGGVFTVNGKLPHLLRRWWTPEDMAALHLRADEVAHALERRPAQGVGAEAWLERARRSVARSAAAAANRTGATDSDEEVRRVCRDAYGAATWGDKYNEHLLDLPWLHRVWPRARWIFLVRDPEQVVVSMLHWSRPKVWNPRDALVAGEKWAVWNQRWLVFRRRLDPDRRVELDYDELCAGQHARLDELVGMNLTPYLADLRRGRVPPSPVPLAPAAQAVGRELQVAGLLRCPSGEHRR